MRIAFAGVRGIPALYSGFETAATEISTRLAKRGHEVIVYCRKGYGDESQPTYEGVKKIYMPRLKTKITDTVSHSFFSLVHLFFHPADVIVIFNAANGPLCIIPTLRRSRYAVNVDGIEWKRGKWGPIGKRYFRFAAWICAKIAPEIIADSRKIQDFYREHFRRETFYAAYGAPILVSERPEILDEYGLKPRDYFLVVARLEPENNTDLIVNAFQGVRTQKRLAIVGGVNYKSKYLADLQRGANDERITFLGPVYNQAHLNELYCNCYAYVHGHEVGGTNPALLRALGCGNCVLYLDVEFNAEVAQDAGVPFPKSAEELRRKMQALLDDPETASRYRELAPERIKQDYTWDKIAGQYEQLCLRLHESR